MLKLTSVMRWLGSFYYVASRRGGISRLMGVLLISVLLLYYVPARPQSFIVSASTETLRVKTIDDGTTEWELPRVEACLRRATPSEASPAIPWCNAKRYQPVLLEFGVIRWSDGYVLTFRSFDSDFIEVLVERPDGTDPTIVDDDKEVSSGSILRIPLEHPDGRALLPLRGFVAIGDVPNASDAMILRGGAYEIRQTLGLFRREPFVVDRGALFPGDRVGFASTPAPIWQRLATGQGWQAPEQRDVPARLFIAELDAGSKAIDLVATTEPAYSVLRLTRIGGQPTTIAVSWTQRLMADALPVAIATLFGLMGSIVALANAYIVNPAGTRSGGGDKASK